MAMRMSLLMATHAAFFFALCVRMQRRFLRWIFHPTGSGNHWSARLGGV